MKNIKDIFESLNIEYNEEKEEQLLGYMEGVLQWNNCVNLTAIVDKEEFMEKHYMDSLLCVTSSEFKEADKIIDVGTAIPTVSRESAYRVDGSALVAPAGFRYYNINLSNELQVYAYNMATRYGVPYELFLAMMYVESGFQPHKISSTNDYGMCQINISNHSYLTRQLGVTNFLDPYQNIQAGAFFLARYFKSWGATVSDQATLELHALNSYNRGDGSYKKYLAQGNTATSWYYGNKVVDARNRLVANGGL